MNPIEPSGETRMDRKKEETRVRIMRVALGLFREQGLGATTMEQIAAAADVAKGTLYNYFPVKEAILDEYIRRTFQERNAERLERLRALPGTRARVVSMFAELMTGVQAQSEIFEKYLAYRMQHWVSFHQTEEEKSGFHLLAGAVVELGRANGEIRADLPAGWLVDLCEFAFDLVVKQFYLAPQQFERDATIEQAVDVFMRGAGK